jgi:hypothetical protein
LASLSNGTRIKVELSDGTTVEGIVQDYDGAKLEIGTKTWRGTAEVISVNESDIIAIHLRRISTKVTIGAGALILGIITTIIIITVMDPFHIGFAPQNI